MPMFTSPAPPSGSGLDALRAEALLRVEAAKLPTAEEEVWRYSRIGELDASRYDPSMAGARTVAGIAAEARVAAALTVRLDNGRLVDVAGAARGVSVARLVDRPDAATVLCRVMSTPSDVFADANTALAPDPVVIEIERNAVIDGPIVIDHVVSGEGAAAYPRLVVLAGENSESVVIETHASGPETAIVVPVVELAVGPAARLRYLTVQDLGAATWQLATQVSDVGRDAYLSSIVVALGGDYARQRLDTLITGRGATADLSAIYHGRGEQTLDFRTFQRHRAPNTRSNLLFKGALDDAARSIYTGLIHIAADAAGVDAFQTNRVIKLSEHAWAESVPNLEIENNDVRCSHASAVGPIDPDHLFFLESRGVPTAVAERLVVLGFYRDVLTHLPEPALARLIDSRLAERLEFDQDELLGAAV